MTFVLFYPKSFAYANKTRAGRVSGPHCVSIEAMGFENCNATANTHAHSTILVNFPINIIFVKHRL